MKHARRLGRTTFPVPFIAMSLLLLLAGRVHADEAALTQTPTPSIHIAHVSFAQWAPEMHELHLRLDIKANKPVGDDALKVHRATINGRPPAYSITYAGGGSHDYFPAPAISETGASIFLPYTWRSGEQCAVSLQVAYGGADHTLTVDVQAPPSGGAWRDASLGLSFRVKEASDIGRIREPVTFDVALAGRRSRDPASTMRATRQNEGGDHHEIPVQIHDIRHTGNGAGDDDGEGAATGGSSVSFAATVQLTMDPGEETTIILWQITRDETPAPIAGAADEDDAPATWRFEGQATGGVAFNEDATVRFGPKSGQLLSYESLSMDHTFDALNAEGEGSGFEGMIYQPDLYAIGHSWSHASDWNPPPHHLVAIGPVFMQTSRWGEMPDVPAAKAAIDYTLFRGRSEVHIRTSLSLDEDLNVYAIRNGGMIAAADAYTHVVWPTQDGQIIVLPAPDTPGNDMGAPPRGRLPLDTPWYAFINKDTGIGIAMIFRNAAWFNTGPHRTHQADGHLYMSLYRNRFLYATRAWTITYQANIRSRPTRLRAGDTMYEQSVLLPFRFNSQLDITNEPATSEALRPVTRLRHQLLNPLIVRP